MKENPASGPRNRALYATIETKDNNSSTLRTLGFSPFPRPISVKYQSCTCESIIIFLVGKRRQRVKKNVDKVTWCGCVV